MIGVISCDHAEQVSSSLVRVDLLLLHVPRRPRVLVEVEVCKLTVEGDACFGNVVVGGEEVIEIDFTSTELKAYKKMHAAARKKFDRLKKMFPGTMHLQMFKNSQSLFSTTHSTEMEVRLWRGSLESRGS